MRGYFKISLAEVLRVDCTINCFVKFEQVDPFEMPCQKSVKEKEAEKNKNKNRTVEHCLNG